MRHGATLVAFVSSTDLDRARAFYVDILGLVELETTPFALVLDGLGTTLRVTKADNVTAAPYTVLGWDVADLDVTIDDLTARGASFVRYDGMPQDDRGAWQSPSGTRVAWFRDPDGNTLSVQQHPA